VLGSAGRDARVVYAQTDSVFLHFPHATTLQAVTLGKQVEGLRVCAFVLLLLILTQS